MKLESLICVVLQIFSCQKVANKNFVSGSRLRSQMKRIPIEAFQSDQGN